MNQVQPEALRPPGRSASGAVRAGGARSFAAALGLAVLFAAPSLRAQTNEYRALWVDAWGAGFRSATEVNTLTNDFRRGHLNTVFAQVRRRGDAFYNSHFEPKNASVTPASFDPLADLIAKCHNPNFGQRLEVHAWIVTYHIWQGTNPPADPTHPLNLHPDWLLRDVNGNTLIGNEYTFDPGHPEVQRHTFNVCMDIVSNYDVDGLNFDYIRYSSLDEGYNPVTVARFNQRFGRTGQPAPADPVWQQFRRDQVTGLLRKIYLNAIALKPGLKISADTITWSPGPTSVATWYASSAAWNTVLQDWRGWLEEGILDLNVPMTYFDQAGAYTQAWTNWNNFTKDNQYNRQALIGPGLYLNAAADAIAQLRFTRTASSAGHSASGSAGYSYRVTNKDGVARAAFLDALVNPSAYDPVTPPLYAQTATIPVMPWKTAPTAGHLKGTIYSGNLTNGLDGAVVTVTGPVTRVQTNDATGFYGFVDLPPGTYTVQAAFSGYAPASNQVTVTAGVVATRDLELTLQNLPAIVGQPESRTNYAGTPATFSVSASGPAPLSYQWRKADSALPGATNSSFSLAAVSGEDAGDYSVAVSNPFGAVTSQVATLVVLVPPPAARLLPLWTVAPGARPYLSSTDSSQRGLAGNPVSGRLLLVSRTGSNTVHVLDAANGADLHVLDNGVGLIAGGTFAVNMIGAADDGAVYVGNLTLDGSTMAFRLYRWADDAPGTAPTVAFSGNPVPALVERWGDTFAVRGAGTNTQILIGSRNGTNAALFTTADGTTFVPHPLTVSGGTNGMFGLGIAFGAGDTFWSKASGQPLRQIAFGLAAGTGTVVQTTGSPAVAGTVTAIGVEPAAGLVGGVAVDTPDTFQLYELSNNVPVLLATQPFATDNANANATGAVDFNGDCVYALDSNNGLLALRILPPAPPQIRAITRLPDGRMQLAIVGEAGRLVWLDFAPSLPFWEERTNLFNPNGALEFIDAAATNSGRGFYRVRQ